MLYLFIVEINGKFDTHFPLDKTETRTGRLKEPNKPKPPSNQTSLEEAAELHSFQVLTVFFKKKLSHFQNVCP